LIVVAEKVYIGDKAAAIDVVKEILLDASEEIEMRLYYRLAELIIEDASLETSDQIRPEDFDLFQQASLPHGNKLPHTKKYNNPHHPCKVLVTIDAIGMGLNLNIGRVIFNSLIKPTTNEKGKKEMNTISTSQALQISGRARQYGTQF